MTALPPPLAKLLATPVLRSELPSGYDHASLFGRAAAPRFHVLGGVVIEFTGPAATSFVSYELLPSPAEAAAFARRHQGGGGRVQTSTTGDFVTVASGVTRANAVALLRAAVRHLRRVLG